MMWGVTSWALRGISRYRGAASRAEPHSADPSLPGRGRGPVPGALPLSIHLSYQDGLFIARGSGRISVDDYAEASSQLWYHPCYTTPARLLVDLRDATLDLSMGEIGRVVALAGQRPAVRVRVAVVAPGDLAFGVSRSVIGILGEGDRGLLDLSSFRNLDPALEWLNRDDSNGTGASG